MFNERDWSAFLSEELGSEVEVRFGRARQRVLESRYAPGSRRGSSVLRVRMSAFFEQAPAEVRAAVAHWLRVGRRARKSSALLDAWIESAVAELPPVAARRSPLRPRGRHHDLDALAQLLTDSSAHLPALTSVPAFTWGRHSGARARRSLQLGCYVAADHLVRVHPVLDQDWVPEWFVRYVLYHELLHAALPTERGSGGRAVHHGASFKRWERSYPDYTRAVRWLDRNLPKLIRSTRKSAARGDLEPSKPRKQVQGAPASRAARSAEARPAPGWLFPFLH